jgi:uncharacterized repeat protein (TIGR03803 family)
MLGKKPGILFITALGLLSGLMTTAAPAFAASKEKVLYSFCSAQLCPDGANPFAGLVSDSSGNLYGTAYYGGNSNCIRGCGTVFQLTRANYKWKLKVLHHFYNNGKDGYYPAASVILDAGGNLYGTTSAGGAYKVGTVFELLPEKDGRWKEKILHSFGSTSSDGWEPDAALVFDSSGRLYGTTQFGGAYGAYYGIVFTLTPGANGHWRETVLHNFDYNGKDGYNPLAGLVFDRSGNLYGTTVVGGTTTNGAVFELTPGKNGSWTERVLYNFTGGSDGSLSNSGLVRDSAGSLYSTTVAGGDPHCTYGGGCGTVFKLKSDTKGSWTFTTLHMFEEKDGAFPEGGLIFDGAGNLYGVTNEGGAYKSGGCQNLGCGTVFKLKPGSRGQWTESVLHSFNDNGVDGWEPSAGLVRDAAGNLYGTTYSGGAHGYGTVFEITP